MNESPDNLAGQQVATPPRVPPPTHQVTAQMIEAVRSTGPWLRLFSILCFICVGFMLLAGFAMLIGGFAGATFGEEVGGGLFLAGMSFVYILLALVYIPPGIFLFRAAGGAAQIKQGHVVAGIEKAVTNQKSFWKFMGIITIAIICFYVIAGVVFVFIGLAVGMR